MLHVTALTAQTRNSFVSMCEEFYTSPAVLHPIPRQNMEGTADEILSGSPFTKGFILESEGEIAGYALLAFTYSNEAGGLVLLLDELYLRDSFRGSGLGSAFFKWLFATYDGSVKRYRLELSEENRRVRALYQRMGFTDFSYLQMILEK